jgi:hypothetical protein
MPTPFFRHARVKVFNQRTRRFEDSPNGGLSFLLEQREDGFAFWLNLTPLTVSFSARQSTKLLRDAYSSGVVEYGVVKPAGRPVQKALLDELLESDSDELSAIARACSSGEYLRLSIS